MASTSRKGKPQKFTHLDKKKIRLKRQPPKNRKLNEPAQAQSYGGVLFVSIF